MLPPPPRSALFPYTTLFRSAPVLTQDSLLGPEHSTPVPTQHSAPSTLREAQAGSSADEPRRSEEHTSELQSQSNLVCRLLLEKKNHTTCSKAAAVLTMHLSY